MKKESSFYGKSSVSVAKNNIIKTKGGTKAIGKPKKGSK